MTHDVQSGGNDLTAYRQRARTWLEANLPRPRREDQVDFAEPSFAEKRDWKRKLRKAGLAGFTRDLKLHRRLRRSRAATARLDAVAASAAPADLVLG